MLITGSRQPNSIQTRTRFRRETSARQDKNRKGRAPMVTSQDVQATTARVRSQTLLAPYLLLRVTGLPFATVEQLPFPRTCALIDELIRLEQEIGEREEQLQEALRAHLRTVPAREIQHKGLDLRRALKTQNTPRVLTLLQAIRAQVPEALSQQIEHWCQLSARRADVLASGEPTLQAETCQNRQTLHQLFRAEAFQHGLLLSSETLYTELQHYLQLPVEKNNNRVRRTEEGLLSYLLRMATKTSPYSTFCGTMLGTWDEQGPPAAQIVPRDWQQSRIARPVSPLLSVLIDLLLACPRVRAHLCVSRNSTLHWLTRPAPEHNEWGKIEVLVLQKVKGRRFAYTERIARLRLNPLTSTLLTILEEAREPLTARHLQQQCVEHVLRLLPTAAAQGPLVEQQVARSLEHLVTHSALLLDLRIPVHEDDRLLCLITRLAAIPDPVVAEIRHSLMHLHHLIAHYGTAGNAEEARLLLAEIRRQVLAICRDLGAHQDPPFDPSEQVDRLYQTFIVEDLVFPRAHPTLARATWEPVLEDLRTLHQLAPLLDFGMRAKMHMDLWAAESLPEAADIVGCHLRFWQEFMPGRASSRERERTQARFVRLRALQQAFVRQLDEQVQRAQRAQARVLQLDEQALARLIQDFPPFLRRPDALAHFGQFFLENGEPRMVLNGTWTSPGAAFSRFTHPFAAAGRDTLAGQVRAYTAELGRRHQTVYASIAETGDINVNSHGRLTAYDILFPASCSQYASEQQLALRDLHATFDAHAGEFRIFSPRLNTRVTPLHLGFSLVRMLPPLYQGLVTTTERYPKFDLLTLLEARLSAEQKTSIRHYPRVVLGHVILNRECWKMPVEAIPVREAGETLFAFCVKLNRWRADIGLPVACFRRVIPDSEIPLADDEPGEDEAREQTTRRLEKGLRKPFYLDFRNALLLSMFHTALKAFPPGTTVTFEEILPTPEQHLLSRDGQSYATECIFELSC